MLMVVVVVVVMTSVSEWCEVHVRWVPSRGNPVPRAGEGGGTTGKPPDCGENRVIT